MTLIALSGLAGSGKTTAANYLVRECGFARRPFAFQLKAMISAGFNIPGDVLDGPREGKEQPLEIFGGKSIRHVMQTLGTEWGRELIHPDVWVRAWEKGAAGLPNVVVDDARFPNEEAAIRRLGGTIVMLLREGSGSKVAARHASERLLLVPDLYIDNNGSIEGLQQALRALLRTLGWRDIKNAGHFPEENGEAA